MKIAKFVMAIALSVILGFRSASSRGNSRRHERICRLRRKRLSKKKPGNDQILRIAKETRKGQGMLRRVVNRDGKEMAIRVDANGKFIGTHPEKGQQKEKAEKILIAAASG